MGIVDAAAHIVVSEIEDDVIATLRSEEGRKAPSLQLHESQPEIDWRMRSTLLDFLMQIQQILRLSQETLMLGVAILDRYTSKRVIIASHYQLVGCVSLWLAAKLQDEKHNIPSISDISYLCAGAFSEHTFREMEFHILDSLDWCINSPTTLDFIDWNIGAILSRVAKIPNYYSPEDYELCSSMARYICECALFDQQTALSMLPSTVAASAVGLSFVIIDALGNRNRPFLCPTDCTKQCFDALAAVIVNPPARTVNRFSNLDTHYAASYVEKFFSHLPITTNLEMGLGNVIGPSAGTQNGQYLPPSPPFKRSDQSLQWMNSPDWDSTIESPSGSPHSVSNMPPTPQEEPGAVNGNPLFNNIKSGGPDKSVLYCGAHAEAIGM